MISVSYSTPLKLLYNPATAKSLNKSTFYMCIVSQ